VRCSTTPYHTHMQQNLTFEQTNSYCNRKFSQRSKFGGIHLVIAFLCQKKDQTLAISTNSCVVPDKAGWKFGYGNIHVQSSTPSLAQTRNYKIWWSYSATFICYEYSCMQAFILQLHVCARKWVELWVYSWTLVWCQTGGGTLGIFMDFCMVPDRGGNLAIFMYCWLDSGKISWLYYSGTLQQRTQYI